MSDLDSILDELDHPKRPKRPPLPNRYVKVLDFNPDSYDQVIELAKFINTHAARKSDRVNFPRRRDADPGDEDALSTEKKYLKRAAKKHPVFQLIIDCRERNKLLTTYNWKLDEQQYVHTVIGHHPSTWRKSSRDYNLQNIPKRSDLAMEFRRMIVAPPGHCIIEGDSSAIEAVLDGYFARSPRLINLAKAGIHDWFNAVIHNEPFSPDLPFDELKALCKAAKSRYSKESREVTKRTIHATAYMTTPMRMNDEYPDEFPTVAIARKYQNALLDTEPGRDLQRWWHETLDRAVHDRYLINPFGFRHRFFHVYGWDSKRKKHTLGDDAKRAIAFLPQSTASAIQDTYIEALWKESHPHDWLLYPFREWLCLPIHDSLFHYVPMEWKDWAVNTLYSVMARPIPELGGLAIGAEIKVSGEGGNWADASEDNPLGMKTVR